jgi:hypothetical protein
MKDFSTGCDISVGGSIRNSIRGVVVVIGGGWSASWWVSFKHVMPEGGYNQYLFLCSPLGSVFVNL